MAAPRRDGGGLHRRAKVAGDPIWAELVNAWAAVIGIPGGKSWRSSSSSAHAAEKEAGRFVHSREMLGSPRSV